jgi:hypothetical protein
MSSTSPIPDTTDTPNWRANQFTFAGDRTQITYFPSAPGPIVIGQKGAGRLEYQGIEGDLTFSGADRTPR